MVLLCNSLEVDCPFKKKKKLKYYRMSELEEFESTLNSELDKL